MSVFFMGFLVLKKADNDQIMLEKQQKLKRISYLWGTGTLTILSIFVLAIDLYKYFEKRNDLKYALCKNY